MASAAPQAPTGLICELLRAPEMAVVTDAQPEFGWIVRDETMGAVQSAYQIQVASSAASLEANDGDAWDPGKVAGPQSTQVSYAGTPLRPNTSYWWRVRTWDADDNAGPYSAPQQFNTGEFEGAGRRWPAESRWVRLENGEWVLENRQRSDYHEIAPERFLKNGEGNFFADFGKAAFATLRLRVSAHGPGEKLTIYLGERRNGNDTVNREPGVSNIGFKEAEITLEEGTHTYTIELPRHHSNYPNSQVLAEHMLEVAPFRYAEISGCPGSLAPEDVRQVALLYYFDDDASRFESSNMPLNRVWELCRYTLKATPFLALYADGNRERMPYEADAYIQQLGHYAVDREYSVARYTNQFLLFNPAWPTEWHMHTVLMAWADYQATGDPETAARFYDDLRAKTLLALEREDGLISTTTGLVTPEFLQSLHFAGKNFRDIVDWPAGTPEGKKAPSNAGPTPEGERDGYDFRDYNTVVNAFHYASLVRMADLAGAVGREDDARFLRERAAKVLASFNKVFFDAERGIYVDGEGSTHAALHANMFPLAFGMVPDENTASVAAFVKSRGMACSVYGAQYLLEGLFQAGESDYAIRLMTADSKRSWLNMLNAGSTMTTEAWDEYYKPNLTWNHAWGSAPANIITRFVLGVRPLEPGYGKVLIQPQPGFLREAAGIVPTIRGNIGVSFHRGSGPGFNLDVSVPANVSAQIALPWDGANLPIVTMDGAPVSVRKEGRTLYLDDVGAGTHSIKQG